MARMQIVPLPTIRYADLERTPFLLVLDQVDEGAFSDNECQVLRHVTGAEAVVCHEGVLDAADVQLTEPQRAALLDRLGLSEGASGGWGVTP